jgi:hypothetical protein
MAHHRTAAPIMLAHGCTLEMLTGLVRDGLATAAPGIMYARNRPIEVTRLTSAATALRGA